MRWTAGSISSCCSARATTAATSGLGSELAFTYVHRGLLDGTLRFPHREQGLRLSQDARSPYGRCHRDAWLDG
jgi:hypothetical protein